MRDGGTLRKTGGWVIVVSCILLVIIYDVSGGLYHHVCGIIVEA